MNTGRSELIRRCDILVVYRPEITVIHIIVCYFLCRCQCLSIYMYSATCPEDYTKSNRNRCCPTILIYATTKKMFQQCGAIALSTIAITHLYIISIQFAIMSIVKPCLHILILIVNWQDSRLSITPMFHSD